MIKGEIIIEHPKAEAIASSLAPDNLPNMKMKIEGDKIIFHIELEKLSSIIASVDDFLMNLKIAEEAVEEK